MQPIRRDDSYGISSPIRPSSVRWMERAACDGTDTDLFFPEVGDMQYIQTIRELCGPCEVRLNCLQYAEDNGIEDGWFGGISPNQRKARRGRLYRR